MVSKYLKVKAYYAHQGSAVSELQKIIENIKDTITFVLSSHLPDIDHPEKINPLLHELDQIKKHCHNTHTILIEYINWIDTPYFGGITLDEIKSKLLTINPNYTFSFEKGGHLEREEHAILAASVRKIG